MVYYYYQSWAARIVSAILTEACHLFPARETPVDMVDEPWLGDGKWLDQ
jgi:hypothetical protein